MCGLAGFAGVRNANIRYKLLYHLGLGIDERGGHAAGFVVNRNGELHEGRKLGYWATAKERFLRRASMGDLLMMHARWMTCGSGGIRESHPFRIERGGVPVLYGAHNGVIYDAPFSARMNNREYDVDSRELFELLADQEIGQIQDLTGYGVITWIETSTPNSVYVARLSRSSEFYITETKCGGFVWGSTPKIVRDALKRTKLQEKQPFILDEIGRVYEINSTGVYKTGADGICFAEGIGHSSSQRSFYDTWREYEEAQEERERYEEELNAEEWREYLKRMV